MATVYNKAASDKLKASKAVPQAQSANPIVEAVASSFINSFGGLAMDAILQKIVDKSKTKGKAVLKAGKVFSTALQEYALETNTKIDDAIADVIKASSVGIAKANGIVI